MKRLVLWHARSLSRYAVTTVVALRWTALLGLIIALALASPARFHVEPADAHWIRLLRPPVVVRREPVIRVPTRPPLDFKLRPRIEHGGLRPTDPLTLDGVARPEITWPPAAPGAAVGPRRPLPSWALGTVDAPPPAAVDPAYRADARAALEFGAIAAGADPAAPGFDQLIENQLDLLAPVPFSSMRPDPQAPTSGAYQLFGREPKPADPAVTIEALNGSVEINRAIRIGQVEIKLGPIELRTAVSAFAAFAGWFMRDLVPVLAAWFQW